MEKDKSRRLAPRYRFLPDENEPIKVQIVQLFSPREELEGFLYDLTPQAVKVRLAKIHRNSMNHYMLKGVLLSFRLKDQQTVTVSKGYLIRNDNLEGEADFASVFMFDLLMEPDREVITDLCNSFPHPEDNSPENGS